MEEKERFEVQSPSLNGYAYIHDFKTDNVLNTYDSCDLLNQQDIELSKLRASYQQVKEENNQLKQQLAITEKALKLCERHHIGFENATHKEQVYWRETRIKENIRYFINKAKEMLENE